MPLKEDEELKLVQSEVEELLITLTPTQLYKLKKVLDLVGEDNKKIEAAVETLNAYL